MALTLRQMVPEDIEEVMRIERSIYPYPWTARNFTDSLDFQHICKVAELDGAMVGYAVLMPVMEEAHLLTIGISAAHQRKGMGGEMLGLIIDIARHAKMHRIILEVRPSNTAARALYQKVGFSEIGMRRGYYPADNNGREDAIVMEYLL